MIRKAHFARSDWVICLVKRIRGNNCTRKAFQILAGLQNRVEGISTKDTVRMSNARPQKRDIQWADVLSLSHGFEMVEADSREYEGLHVFSY